jgi:hypothetical protein
MSVVLPIDAPQSDHDQACLVELMKYAAALAESINRDRFSGIVPDDEATVTLCKTLDICLSILIMEK